MMNRLIFLVCLISILFVGCNSRITKNAATIPFGAGEYGESIYLAVLEYEIAHAIDPQKKMHVSINRLKNPQRVIDEYQNRFPHQKIVYQDSSQIKKNEPAIEIVGIATTGAIWVEVEYKSNLTSRDYAIEQKVAAVRMLRRWQWEVVPDNE